MQVMLVEFQARESDVGSPLTMIREALDVPVMFVVLHVVFCPPDGLRQDGDAQP
jgi:hypothetical protein